MKKTPGSTATEREVYWTNEIQKARAYPGGVTAYCTDTGLSKENYYSWFRKLRAKHPEWEDLSRNPTHRLKRVTAAKKQMQPQIELRQKAQRRRFTAKEKSRILREVDAAPPGQKAAILRREGIYTSHVQKWRLQLEERALAPRKRGPKTDDRDARIKELEKRNAKLEKDLKHAKLYLELQKKVAEILGTPASESDS